MLDKNNICTTVCSSSSKCKSGAGPCNTDDECREGLRCGTRNCPKLSDQNCCYKPNGNNINYFYCIIEKLSKIIILLFVNSYIISDVIDWKPSLPSKKKYFFADRMVKGLGMIAKFSDSFDALDANVWTLMNSFWAYPAKYPGTKVNINFNSSTIN